MNEKSIVVVDLDGTLANGDHRLHHLYPKEKRNWDAYYERCIDDMPHQDVISIVSALARFGFRIVILTGRREETRTETEAWLDGYVVPYDHVIMRPPGHHEDDDKWKVKEVAKIGKEKIFCILEDRNRVVKALRAEGYRVCQVAEGDF